MKILHVCRSWMIVFLTILIIGCAQQPKFYGIPQSVWQQLTPEQQQQIISGNMQFRQVSIIRDEHG